MRFLISFLLEPLSLTIYLVTFLAYTFWLDSHARYKILAGYYLLGSILLFQVFRVANIQVYNTLYTFASIAIGFYFHSILYSKVKRVIVVIMACIPVGYFIINNTFLGGENVFDSWGYVLSSLGIATMIFLYFHQILSNVKEESLALNFDFWYISAQLIYQLGAFGIFLSYNYFTKKILLAENYSDENRTILTSLWGVHNVLLFLSALLTSCGLLWIVYHKKFRSS